VPGRVGLNHPQLTYHVTGDIDGAPAGQHGLKAIERANETI
jgi:hypothetical protein